MDSSSDELLTIRPLEPVDERAFCSFLGSLSDEDLAKRFGRPVSRTNHILKRFLFHSEDMSKTTIGAFDSRGAIVGTILLGRVTRDRGEIALVIATNARSRGVGRRLISATKIAAKAQRFKLLEAYVALDNPAALRLARRSGFCAVAICDRHTRFQQVL